MKFKGFVFTEKNVTFSLQIGLGSLKNMFGCQTATKLTVFNFSWCVLSTPGVMASGPGVTWGVIFNIQFFFTTKVQEKKWWLFYLSFQFQKQLKKLSDPK